MLGYVEHRVKWFVKKGNESLGMSVWMISSDEHLANGNIGNLLNLFRL